MKSINVINIILITVFLLLLAFDLLLVLPEYCACRHVSEGATATTIWGYELDCIGDTAEFSWIFFQQVGIVALIILTAVVILFVISHIQKSKNEKEINE